MVELIPLQHGDFTVDTDADLAYILKERGAVVFHRDDGMPDTFGGLCEGAASLVDVVALGIWYGVAVRVELGRPQEPIEPLHQFFRFDVFQLLRNVVYFVPAEAELVK